MLGQFNPYRAGSPVQAPNVSATDLLNATNMQNQNVAGLMDTINNVGTTARSTDVIDLIKSGGLNGATSQDALSKLLGLSDGGVDANAKTVMDNLVKSKTDKETASALAMSNLEKEKLKAQNDLIKQNVIGNQKVSIEQLKQVGAKDLADFNAKQTMALEKYKQGLKLTEQEKKIVNFGIDKILNVPEILGLTTDLAIKSNAGDPSKFNLPFGLKIDPLFGMLNTSTEDMSDSDQAIIRDISASVLSDSKAAAAGAFNSPELIVDAVNNKLGSLGKKLDTEFNWTNLLPGGKSPRVSKIVDMTDAEKKAYARRMKIAEQNKR